MRITISGMPGSGKSYLAAELVKKFDLKRYSVGDFMRNLAKERGLSLIELNKLGEKDKSIDKQADDWQTNLGKKEDKFIIDGRISYHFIPNSIKLFLKVSPEEGSERIRGDNRETEKADSHEEMVKLWKERVESDRKRYKKYYNLNPLDESQYDFVVDTTNLTKEEVVSRVVKFVEKFRKK